MKVAKAFMHISPLPHEDVDEDVPRKQLESEPNDEPATDRAELMSASLEEPPTYAHDMHLSTAAAEKSVNQSLS